MVANVARQAVLITDAYNSYKGADQFVSEHMTVKHTEGCYVTEGYKHTNGIEGFWSLLKRGIIGIYHYVSPQHLYRYCEEFQHRYNARKTSSVERFLDMAAKSDKECLTYKLLTSSPNPKV